MTAEEGAPLCVEVAEVCRGSAGEAVCDGEGMLYECDEDGLVSTMTACPSPRHCMADAQGGTCAVCLRGTTDEYRCEGAELQRCSEQQDGYETVEACATEALCSASAGACTSSTCKVGQRVCDGDTLETCNDGQSAFEVIETCGPGLCDAEAGVCDACVPGARSCADSTTRTACSEDGSELVENACDSATPVCVGNGRCVQCRATADCPDPGPCLEAYCHVATGTCEPQNAQAGSMCPAGKCNGVGECVECVDPGLDCPQAGACQLATCTSGTCGVDNKPAGERCSSGYCNGQGACSQCTQAAHCPDPGSCKERHCNTSTGQCEPRAADFDTPCDAGYCDQNGNCRGCTDKSQCGNPGLCHERACVSGVCDPQAVSNGTCTGSFGPGFCASGSCVQCRNKGDCGDAPGPCQDWACESGNCALRDANGGVCESSGGAQGECLNGRCYECLADTDCRPANECKRSSCYGGSCGPEVSKGNGTACTQGNGQPGECADGICGPICGDGVVSAGEDCEPNRNGYHCTDECEVRLDPRGSPVSDTVFQACYDPEDCRSGETCAGLTDPAFCMPDYDGTACMHIIANPWTEQASTQVGFCYITCRTRSECPGNMLCDLQVGACVGG